MGRAHFQMGLVEPMTRVFPQFPMGIETKLAAVKMAAGTGEDAVWYFADPSCPYPVLLKATLQAWLAPGAPGGTMPNGNLAVSPLFQEGSSGQTDEQQADQVLMEVQRTIDAMRNIEAGLEPDDTEGRMSILKSKTTLLEKWVGLRERTIGLKQVAEFQRMVLHALDDTLEKEVVQKFKDRLKEIGET